MFNRLNCVMYHFFQAITNTKDMSRLVQCAIFFNAMVINAFFQNWQGQRIIDYSEKVYEYAYV